MTTLNATTDFLARVDEKFLRFVFSAWNIIFQERPRKHRGRHVSSEKSGEIYFWILVSPVLAFVVYWLVKVVSVIHILL